MTKYQRDTQGSPRVTTVLRNGKRVYVEGVKLNDEYKVKSILRNGRVALLNTISGERIIAEVKHGV